jgi:hypothetical protein
VFPSTKRFQGILITEGSFPFYREEPIMGNIDLSNHAAQHDSFIIFGQNRQKLPTNIDLTTSSLPTKYLQPVLSHESNENIVRSVAVVGDINHDTYPDLVVGYRFSSLAIVYFGKEEKQFTSLSVSFTIYGIAGTEFGWATSGLGDISGDSVDDFMISAKGIGTIYIFFGKVTLPTKNNYLYADQLSATEGFKIVGTSATVHTGVALSNCGDFNNDGQTDILFSTQTRASSQGIIYILFGNRSNIIRNISMDNLEASTAVLTIIAPTFRLSGWSLAGIGDINNDGFDDIAIGSLPIKGISSIQSQTTYLVYGRPVLGSGETLDLNLMREGVDGITIFGAGFMVTGTGDLNGDGIADLMIVNYPTWQGKFGSYFVQYPENFTNSPTLAPTAFPSSQPSASPSLVTVTPSFFPTGAETLSPTPVKEGNETNQPQQSRSPTTIRPSRSPSHRPNSLQPTLIPSMFPSFAPTFSPSRLPSASPVPSLLPTLLIKSSSQPTVDVFLQSGLPTVDFHRLRGSSTPSQPPTVMPTINATNYINVDCSKTGVTYEGTSANHYKFIVTLGAGTVQLIGNEDGGAKNLFILQSCPSDDHRLNVVIKNFRLSTDILSVAHVSGFSSTNDLAYSLKAGQPLTLLFCSDNKLQLILSSHTSLICQKGTSFSSRQRQMTDERKMNRIGMSCLFRLALSVVCWSFSLQYGEL